jgi:altronate dehydratase large subunit
MLFFGYERPDGKVGIRNYVGVLSMIVCANEVAKRIVEQVDGAVAFVHSQGCGQTAPDLAIVNRTLASLGCNPNLGAVLLVSLGCESSDLEWVRKKIEKSGKTVKVVNVQAEGGLSPAVAKGVSIVRELVAGISTAKRREFGLDKLCIGFKCGASDTTSGIIANPVVGHVADLLVEKGGRIVVGETTEFIGAEHIVAAGIEDEKVRERFLAAIANMEERVLATGTDMRDGSQPSKGNKAGGLTTLEEKSLGSAAKAGKTPIRQVIDYGCQATAPGVVMVDAPAREPELLTALAAAGAQLIIFTTGRGAPQGFPFVPVLKVTGNKQTYDRMKEHIDVCIAPSAFSDLENASVQVLELIARTASGELTAAEKLNYATGDIAVMGPIV